ncbi:MAG: UDP-2,3-diacylglucosamine pyrophosphatase [Hirschia sp.]|nr:UDP-2,3-diacylglucosamine pyrophosphatase [Hirschia sp.]MBF18022.1 UDP-2,3-diacylglucosamine pyrophosphatase [Hirschia sp.]|tara:strand:- start:3016 stop:3888 length:873 start_codon:yes stop_codon:yes gene_type:complete
MSEVPAKLGLIAGGGNLPAVIASGAIAQGREVYIVGVKGFVEPDLLKAYQGIELSVGETGKQIRALRDAGVEELCFAGIVHRPDFKSFKVDSRGLKALPKIVAAARKGDDALLRAILAVFEREGFKVVGADDVLESLLVPQGALTELKPSESNMADIRKAAFIAAEIGQLDIGQGAVCCRGLVLAVEAQEGTDLMLQRCAGLPEELRGRADKRDGVLVKRPKPVQERRIDLPTIGLSTLRGVAAAGLAGIALEASNALILDQAELVAEANDLGIWIYGFTNEEVSRSEKS